MINHFLEQDCERVDADVFTGDALTDPENRTMLETYLGRWSRNLAEYTGMQAAPEVLHIISEPGDGTRYDYLVYRDGPAEFCFMPARSTFRFPQRLNYWKDKDYDVNLLAVEHNCNPHTIIECIRVMKELHR